MFDRNLVFHTVLYSVYRLQTQIQKALSRFENEYVVYQCIRLGEKLFCVNSLYVLNSYHLLKYSFVRIFQLRYIVCIVGGYTGCSDEYRRYTDIKRIRRT